MSHLAKWFFLSSSKHRPLVRLKFPRPPSWMARNALRADGVSGWLLCTVKMPLCEAFTRSNQTKNRKDMSISLHVFPKDCAVLGFKLSEVRLYQNSAVYVRSISMLIASNTRWDFRMSCLDHALGSENLNPRLFPRSFPTNQPDRR